MLVLHGVEVLDVREAAAFVGRTPETIRRWVWTGRVPALREGNRLYIARRDLEAQQHEEPAALSLAQWAASIPRAATSDPVSSASTLVLEDRWAVDHGR